MLSRKSLVIFVVTTVSLLALLVTSRRLGTWSVFDDAYLHPDIRKSKHAPQLETPLTTPTPSKQGNIPNISSHAHATPPLEDPTKPSLSPGPSSMCDGFPDTSNILLVMKTGASESYARVPTQLMTVLKCHAHFLIFSDMAQTISGYQVFDSLDTVVPSVMEGNSDFDLYRRQKACIIDHETCNKLGNPASEGWRLDKYKNVHIAEKAYAMRPGFDWYVFIDADTYVLWHNMVQFLAKHKATTKHYLGSVTMINGFGFGHGGSGYVVSQAAMAEFIGRNPGVGNAYDLRARGECCGDYVFALAMKELADIKVEQVWPTINGEKPTTLPFGPSNWCHPIVTMHHMNSEEIDTFWSFEQDWYNTQLHAQPRRPLLIMDIFNRFFRSQIQARRVDWDNLSDDRYYVDLNDTSPKWQNHPMKDATQYNEKEKFAHLSPDDCEAACKSVKPNECYQWKYEDGACSFGRKFMMGKPVKTPSDHSKRKISGWDLEKIGKFISNQNECEKYHWPGVQD